MTATLQNLFRAKAWADAATLSAMRDFETADPAREIAIRIASHAHIVDRIFAAHLAGAQHGYPSANAGEAPPLEVLADGVAAIDAWYVDYAPSLDAAQLAERLDFTFTDGAQGRMSREEMLMHVLTHGAGHRGQLAWILMQSAITPGVDGFTTFLHTAEAAERRRTPAAPEAPSAGRPSAGSEPPASWLDVLTARMRAAVGAGEPLGKTLKFDLKGDGFIFVDGPAVSNDDRPAELTLSVGIDDLRAIGQGKLSPMAAMVSKRLGVSDMGVALGLQGRMQALFARMSLG